MRELLWGCDLTEADRPFTFNKKQFSHGSLKKFRVEVELKWEHPSKFLLYFSCCRRVYARSPKRDPAGRHLPQVTSNLPPKTCYCHTIITTSQCCAIILDRGAHKIWCMYVWIMHALHITSTQSTIYCHQSYLKSYHNLNSSICVCTIAQWAKSYLHEEINTSPPSSQATWFVNIP